MRATFHDQSIVRNDEGQIIGINLGYDFCAEHEWGIKGIKDTFQIPEKLTRNNAGWKNRAVNRFSDGLIEHVDHDEGIHYLWVKRYPWQDDSQPHDLKLWGTKDLATAWGSDDFGIAVRLDTEGSDLIPELLEAFRARDVLIFQSGPSNPFGGSGLCIVIKSRVPDDWMDEARKQDIKWLDLQEAAEKTGIEKKLKKAGLGWYALIPNWDDQEAGTVKFFLNPHDQQANNFGWFTVADLKSWTKGEGPIPKTRADT